MGDAAIELTPDQIEGIMKAYLGALEGQQIMYKVYTEEGGAMLFVGRNSAWVEAVVQDVGSVYFTLSNGEHHWVHTDVEQLFELPATLEIPADDLIDLSVVGWLDNWADAGGGSSGRGTVFDWTTLF